MFDGKYHGHADELLGARRRTGASSRRAAACRRRTRHVRLVALQRPRRRRARTLPRGDVAVRGGRGGDHEHRGDLPATAFTRACAPRQRRRHGAGHRRDAHPRRRARRPDRALGPRPRRARDREVDLRRRPARRVRHDARGRRRARRRRRPGTRRRNRRHALRQRALDGGRPGDAGGGPDRRRLRARRRRSARRLADGIEAVAAATTSTGAPTGSTTGRATRTAPEPRRTPPRRARASTWSSSTCSGSTWPTAASGRRSKRGPRLRDPDDEADVDRYLEVLDGSSARSPGQTPSARALCRRDPEASGPRARRSPAAAPRSPRR